MTVILTALFFAVITLAAVTLVAKSKERAFLWSAIVLAWIILLPLVTFLNDWMPFSGSGDDEDYYYLAVTPISIGGSIFDISRFAGYMEQPGYPWLLALVHHVTGQGLYVFKLSNLMFLILLAIVWYRIATLLESPAFGKIVLFSILALTPLWFYIFVLRKEIVIILLQSLFLLGLVEQDRRTSLWPWLLILASTIALIPFRSALVIQNAAILLSALMLRSLRFNRRGRGKLVRLALGGIIVVSLLVIASNPAIMEIMGIHTEHRIAGSTEMVESAYVRFEESQVNRALFPLLYLFSETAGLSPSAWEQLDAGWLRGLLALPWIFIIVPLFLLGIRWLISAHHHLSRSRRWLGRLRRSRVVMTPWGALVLFVMSSASISWVVGDTTRWRTPDMPVIATIAMSGWYYSASKLRQDVLFYWITGMGALLSMFYLLKEM